VHILATLSRGWDYIYTEGNYETPDVDILWPNEGGGTYYSIEERRIYISPGTQWIEHVYIHEYGHHWDWMFSQERAIDYCNGVCDPNPPTGCSHCDWCPETAEVAYTEGFAEWFEDRVTWELWRRHDVAIGHLTSFEYLARCTPTSTSISDPDSTEGVFAAFLIDVMDGNQEDDPEFPGVADVLEFPFSIILGFTDSFEPVTVASYVQEFFDFNSGWQTEIWETAANCGYQLDSTPPGVVLDLDAPSHTPGVPSADTTPHFTWTHAPEAVSGISGYSVSLTPDAPQAPDTIQDLMAVTGVVWDHLPPGSYWFTIRAVDRARNWSPDCATYGPVVVRDPIPVNLLYVYSLDWSRPLIPRPYPDANPGQEYLDDPEYLYPAATYVNMLAGNVGEVSTGVGPAASYFVDEEIVTHIYWPEIPPFGPMSLINLGPYVMPAGRHVFHSWIDSYEVVPETDETDNLEGHQWVWVPETLGPATTVTRAATQPRTAARSASTRIGRTSGSRSKWPIPVVA